ncbi:MAG: DUF4292 domain-containing protein [Deltaproteobacteria bacterium]|nr:DUF4292 domain-containing protein [Deltaproteobacteria bacterium]
MRAGTAAAAAVVVAFAVFFGGGCPHHPELPDVSTLTDEQVSARLHKSAERRRTLEGVIKARLPGLEGVVVNATLDVAVRAPADLSVAVRSFFDMPQQVLAAFNGEVVLYDATTGSPRFFRGPASDRTLTRVLGLPLGPDDAAALLLGRAPLDTRAGWPPPRLRLVSVDEEHATYTVQIDRPGRGAVVVTARATDDALVSAELFRGDGRKLVSARFEQLKDHDGVVFADRIALIVKDTGQALVLEVQEARFNQPLDDVAFILVPPEGSVVLPL